jgi:hypothetical protein
MSSLPKPLGQPWDGSRSILLQESADRTTWIQRLGPDCRTGCTNWAERIKIHSTCHIQSACLVRFSINYPLARYAIASYPLARWS